MSWSAITALAVAIVLIAVGAASVPGAVARHLLLDLRQATATATPERSDCIVVHDKMVRPREVLLGETTQITLTSRFVCPSPVYPFHLVLVLDASGSMAGSGSQQMKDAAVKFVKGLNLPDNPATRIAVVGFNTTARVLTDLTNSEGRVIGSIRTVGASKGSAMDRGLRESLSVLQRGRGDAKDGAEIYEFMVLFSDGGNNAGCQPVLQAAATAKGEGVLLASVCISSACDAQCMRQVASSPRYFYQTSTLDQLISALEQLRVPLTRPGVAQLTITDTLPSNIALVPDSVRPAPQYVSTSGDTIVWKFNPSSEVTLTMQVEPVEAGTLPTNLKAEAVFLDTYRRFGSYEFEIPSVRVLQADWRTTAIPIGSPTPTPMTAATATPDEVSRRTPMYVPIGYNEEDAP